MKILLIEISLTGHHLPYLNGVIRGALESNEVRVIVPYTSPELHISDDCVYIVPFLAKGLSNYKAWVKAINKIAENYEPDVIHFLYGDILYRYFGFGIGTLKKKFRVIITCHQIRRSFLRDYSLRRISEKCSAVVVHTTSLQEDLLQAGIKNVVHIEYPQFNEIPSIAQKQAKTILEIPQDNKKVLLAIGGTRYDKGLDILLEALCMVKNQFRLIIAGEEEYFDHFFIEKKVAPYKENVTLILGFLSEELFAQCLSACDIVVLPYRKSFDGASGPLGEGVNLDKMIVGPNHGSLGRIIETNNLGLTFESEDVNDLAQTLDQALVEKWQPDEAYLSYQNMLSPRRFQAEYLALYLQART